MALSLKPAKHSIAAMTVAAVGVVYGDIGTSPLYTMKAVFGETNGLALIPANIIGIVSLIIWGLILVVGLKYVYLMLKADNRGEGGILALLALVHTSLPKGRPLWYRILLLMGVFGASLFYGDSVITPAVSVLSAMEGFEVATPFFKPYVVPLAIVIIVVLYSIQSKGTEGIAKWVGPLMLLWFGSLAAMGIVNIIRAPVILQAFNPWFAINFIKTSPGIAFIALGAIVLALTGAEALYADLGHFGPTPIRLAWFFIVFPALALNYMGQGGLLIVNPAAIVNPFFQQLGAWSIYPLIALSTIAV
ncbi:MAG: KUP/HAK/KT family potassium transporter, partial [Oxalobacter sp.]|nr:KUP/HAK/KT family potassium transporter [Oxalobacter sp.]